MRKVNWYEEFKKNGAVTVIAFVLFLGGSVNATPTAGSLYVPPEETGPQSFTYSSGGGPEVHTFYNWPNYLTGMYAGTPWRLDVTGINVTGVTGPVNRTIYFQLADFYPVGGTIYESVPQVWNSLLINIKLDNDFGSGQVDADLLQLQESAPVWQNLSSGGYHNASVNRADLDLRMEFYKENPGDPWYVTPSFRLAGGDWTVFDQGSAYSTNNWDFGAPEGQIWPDYGGTMFNVVFDHQAAGTVSFDNARIYAVPVPGAILLGGIGAGIVGWMRRRRAI